MCPYRYLWKKGLRLFNMLDILVIRVLSILFVVGTVGRFGMLALSSRKQQDMSLVKASKPTGFILHHVWLFLDMFSPLIFYLLGATMPSWVYRAPLNISFNGSKFLHTFCVFLLIWRSSNWHSISGHRTAPRKRRHRGPGETQVNDKRTIFSNQKSNPHQHPPYGFGLHPAISPHTSGPDLSYLYQHSLQEGSSGGRTPLF
jgi:hypothetical protein